MLCPGKAVPFNGICCVLRNALALLNHLAHQVLSAMSFLCHSKAEKSNSLCIVPLTFFAIVETYS
jgi:hypothetical protein